MTRSSSLAMQPYSVQPRDLIFVKGYGFLTFTRNMGKNVGKNIRKNLSSKYSQKLLDHTKQFATDALKTASKRAIQKTAEATGDLTGNKIADKIIRTPKTSPNEQEILRERFISSGLRHKTIDDLRLRKENY